MARLDPADPQALERDVQAIGRRLHAAFPHPPRGPAARLDGRVMTLAQEDPDLRAALFRFVDVYPACRSRRDVAAHLLDYVGRVEDPPAPLRAARCAGRSAGVPVVSAAAAAGVRRMARRFIVGRDPRAALGVLRHGWKGGVAATVDLLGEKTVTVAEADRYAERCADALRTIARAARGWPPRPLLEADSAGPLPRANLSVKVSALTPRLHPDAPEEGVEDAAGRMRGLLRIAREEGAHLHVDMESCDGRETTRLLVMRLLAEEEFAEGPSAGVVVQAYLRDSSQDCRAFLDWAQEHRRAAPLTVRLVKGAYWDNEVALALQHGWEPPVFTRKADCDLNFERLAAELLAAGPCVRPAIASHNLRSVAYAVACSRALGRPDGDIEVQVLRGLGDPLAEAVASLGLRCRVYSPVGDLVAGMAYLVRRLLENTSNESFLAHQAEGAPIEELLRPPDADPAAAVGPNGAAP